MRAEKQLLLDEIKEKINGSKGFVVARYSDFTATRARAFRDHIAEIGGEFEVVRKRVFIKAAKDSGCEFDVATLDGHVGVIFAQDDATQIAKGTVKYGEDNDQSISVLGGHIEGEFCSAEDVQAIAKLPSLPELRAQILGLFEAPMSQTVGAVQAVLTCVLYCLEEKSKKN
ncbi:MAG: 50S ribosomal protein L10 [Chlamydiales bacterium]|nr:50S ribosomal protein L10 [Chlamydiales bacterium]